MSRDIDKKPTDRNNRSKEDNTGIRIAPGKVTLTSRLAPHENGAVQCRTTSTTANVPQSRVKSAQEWTHDSWMDAAHRGTTLPVQAKGSTNAARTDGGSDSVRRVAAAGIDSGSRALPHLDTIHKHFGAAHDLSAVRAHVGGAAAVASDSLGAAAYAIGENIAFRNQPDLHTAAHEAAHVVQQRAGVQLADGIGRAGDRYERHADAVADAVVAGRSAAGLLAEMTAETTGTTPASATAIQRFESHEHKVLGDKGTRTEQGQKLTVEVAPEYFLTFGDITAMAGDFFASVSEIERIAANDGKGAGTREEIEYVRVVKVHGETPQEERYSKEARDAVMARYYRLAGNNSSHFTEPRGHTERTSLNNAGNYRDNHDNAVREAARAATAGESIDRALLCEGFASHFLTDAYAAGHVRTERIDIGTWWNPRVPMFWTNLRLLIAEEMARYINDNTTIAGALTVQALWETVHETILNMNLPTLTFGDFVSGAVHDYDNKKGVKTQHGHLVGDAQLRNAERKEVINPVTRKRVSGADHTEDLAIAAVRISVSEVTRAFQLGSTNTPEQVVATLRDGGEYAAERSWPTARPDSEQSAARPSWQQPDVASLINGAAMREAIEIFAHNKAQFLEKALTFQDQAGGLVSAELQARGFRTRIIEPLRSNPIAMLQRIINYTPNTGGGLGGSDSDDNALAYVGMVRSEGGMAALTATQRTQLIRDLVAGRCRDDEEQAVIELLGAASSSEMTAIVTDLGGGNAKQGIEFLDAGIDGSQWDTLQGVLRNAPELARHL